MPDREAVAENIEKIKRWIESKYEQTSMDYLIYKTLDEVCALLAETGEQ